MNRCICNIRLLFAAFLMLFAAGFGYSQDDEVIRINVDNVVVPVSVLDRSGKYISTLKQSDFKIFEDGVEQEITSFETTDGSVTVFMLLERNGAIRFQLPRLVAAANAFVRQMRPMDRFSAVTFGADRFTPIPETYIKDVPKGIRIETRVVDRQIGPNGPMTLLYEAVDEGVKKIQKIQGRKAIVLFSEGSDAERYSNPSAKSTLKDAEESGATIYTVKFNSQSLMIVPDSVKKSKYYQDRIAQAKKYMTDLAVRTGGRTFDVEKIEDLDATFAEVASELVRQYTLGYAPSKTGSNGERRKITVKVTTLDAVVRARKEVVYKKANK